MVPSEYICLDETLYPMRHQINFKQYNPNKPAKYGTLFKSINEVRYSYTYRASVYAGKPADEYGPYYISGTENYVKDLVQNLAKHVSLQGRNISMDRLYTSIPLAKWLLTQDMTSVGTLTSNRVGIPDELKSPKNRNLLQSTTHWEATEGVLSITTYTVGTAKGKKNVMVLSTMPPLLGVTRDDGKLKPAIIKFYDFTKGGTDVVDQRISSYTCKAKSPRWTMAGFSYILDQCRINSSTVWSLNNRMDPQKVDAFDYGWDMAMSLVYPLIQRRSAIGLNWSTQQKIKVILGAAYIEENVSKEVHKAEGPRRRCESCLTELRGKANWRENKNSLLKNVTQCQSCEKPKCRNHLLNICEGCFNNK